MNNHIAFRLAFFKSQQKCQSKEMSISLGMLTAFGTLSNIVNQESCQKEI